MLSFYFTGTGFFITQRLTTAAIFVMVMAYLALALLQAESLTVTAMEDATGVVSLQPEWDTPAGPLQRRSLASAGAASFGEDFLFNASIGFDGQLQAELDDVRATWRIDYNATSPSVAAGSFTAGTYEASFGLLQLGFFSVLPYFLELWLETSLAHALLENVVRAPPRIATRGVPRRLRCVERVRG